MSNDTNIEKMFRTVVNDLSTLRMEMLKGFKEVNKKIDDLDIQLNKRIDDVEERLDKIGKQVAYLEDDAPTREEFENLERKVNKLVSESPQRVL